MSPSSTTPARRRITTRRSRRAALRGGRRRHREDQAAGRPRRGARADPRRRRCARSRRSPSPRRPRASSAAGSARRSSDSCTTPPPRRTGRASRPSWRSSDLDGAAIGTVHSFAQRILAEHPVEAGLPPHVEVLDEVESLLAFGRRWEAHVDRMFADRATSTRSSRSRAGSRSESTIRSSRRCATSRRCSPTTGTAAPRSRRLAIEVPAIDRTRAMTAIAAFGPVLDECRAIADDKLAAHWLAEEEELLRLAAAFVDAPDRRLLGAVHGTARSRPRGPGKGRRLGLAQGRGPGARAGDRRRARRDRGRAHRRGPEGPRRRGRPLHARTRPTSVDERAGSSSTTSSSWPAACCERASTPALRSTSGTHDC